MHKIKKMFYIFKKLEHKYAIHVPCINQCVKFKVDIIFCKYSKLSEKKQQMGCFSLQKIPIYDVSFQVRFL